MKSDNGSGHVLSPRIFSGLRPLIIACCIFGVLLLCISMPGLAQGAITSPYTWAGLGGGAVWSMVWTGTTLYAGAWNGHVYRYDGGTTWTNIGGIPSGDILSMTWNGTTLFVGDNNNRVYRYDGGTTWTDLAFVGTQPAWALASSDTNVYAGSLDGQVYRYDGGTTWTAVMPVAGSPVYTLMWNGSTLYSGCEDGHVWRYEGAASWTDLGDVGGPVIRDLTWNGTDVFAATNNGYVFRYDGGTTWTDTGFYVGTYSALSLCWNGTNVYVGSNNYHIYRYDGGTTWTDVGSVGDAPWALVYNGTTLFSGCDNGHVYRDDGGGGPWTDTWPLGGTYIRDIAFNGPDLYAGCTNGHVYRRDGGTAWTDVKPAGGAYVMTLGSDGSNLFASLTSGDVLRYNGGTSWSNIGNPSGLDATSFAWNGHNLFIACNGGQVYRYEGGSTWTNITPATSGGTYSLTWDGNNIYLGRSSGHVLRYDGGTSWTDVGVAGSNDVEALAWNGGNVYAANTDGHVYRYDGGTTWTDTWPGAPSSVTSLESDGSALYAGCADGHAYLYDGGTTWIDTGITGGSYVTAVTTRGADVFASGYWGVYTSSITAPTVTSITPSSGSAGTTVSVTGIKGTGFYGTPRVRLKRSGQANVTATNVVKTGSTAIACDLPIPEKAAIGKWDLYVENPDGQGATLAGAFNVTSHQATWYLAEGTNAWGFNTYITIENPNDRSLHARLTYMDPNPAKGSGVVATKTIVLPPLSQTTVSSATDIGPVDFSTEVQCLEGEPIAVDRTMFWQAAGAPSPEGHSSVGATTPSATWYLPEGSSAWGFETWTLVQNPGPTDSKVKLTYMIEGQGPKQVDKTVPAHSRASYNMAADIGAADASVEVTSDNAVIAERSMYRNSRREGSCSIGATAPAKQFFLAEGSTAWGFTTYVLVQNPNNSDAKVTLTYLTAAGESQQTPFTMGANSRKTVRVNDAVPGMDLSTKVSADKPIIAERAMYWRAGTPLGEAMHDSVGLASPHMIFYLPDGQTSNGWETWTLVANPNPGAVTVRVNYLPQGGGKTVSFTDEIPAGSRRTYNMADKVADGRASVEVQSLDGARPIMVERAMYWNSRGAGTDTIGAWSD